MKPLFVIGNKHSGTSLLLGLLNRHPNIFITYESDIAWILYCKHHGLAIEKYPKDGPIGFEYSLKIAGELLAEDRSVRELYCDVQTRLMEHAEAGSDLPRKSSLLWLGDKKPVQQADPRVVQFLAEHFPEARCLHIMRHPLDWLRSLRRSRRDIQEDDAKLLSFWLENEKNALQVRESFPVLSFAYRELCLQQEETLQRIFSFLEVPAEFETESWLECAFKTYDHSEAPDLPPELSDFMAGLELKL